MGTFSKDLSGAQSYPGENAPVFDSASFANQQTRNQTGGHEGAPLNVDNLALGFSGIAVEDNYHAAQPATQHRQQVDPNYWTLNSIFKADFFLPFNPLSRLTMRIPPLQITPTHHLAICTPSTVTAMTRTVVHRTVLTMVPWDLFLIHHLAVSILSYPRNHCIQLPDNQVCSMLVLLILLDRNSIILPLKPWCILRLPLLCCRHKSLIPPLLRIRNNQCRFSCISYFQTL